MAVLLSCATGNLTSSSTWALVDSTSYSNSEATAGTPTTTYALSSTFTPGAITVDALAIKLAARTGTTGTISVALDQGGSTVAGTEVTINMSDLPASSATTLDGGWIVFKMASPVTLAAATAYSIKVKTSSSTQATVFVTATTNWSRALRTTTAQAPVAGDDLIVAGEHTGAGTGNSFTVTNDQTASTDYGSNTTSLVTPAVAICKRGTLKFADSSAANPYLRLSGYLIVYNGGELDIGTTGTPIPRDSTAVLEFDCAADGDFGLVIRNGGVFTAQGLSRTSGKNAVSCKLTADTPANLIQAVSSSTTNFTVTTAQTVQDPTGTSLGASSTVAGFNQLLSCVDTAVSGNHGVRWTTSASFTNVTQVFTLWVKRGTGTNNRYVRIQAGTTTATPPSNGFYADFDLQAGTAGTCTAVGNGTATSASITAFGGGYICTIIGKISSGASTANVGIYACNASGGVTYTGDATQNFITTWGQLYTASSQPTDLTVDTDTGWKSGDVVAIASTTRTAAECEVVKLGADAGASTMTLGLHPSYAHSGTSPTQAEVILLTRNVKIRGVNPTFMSFVTLYDGCTVDVDWTEFYALGSNTTNKRGIEIAVLNAANPYNISIKNSSLHDTENNGFYINTIVNTLTALEFSSNTLWNLSTSTGPSCQIGALTSTAWVFDGNIAIRNGNNNYWTLSDIGGTFTNNTVVGAASSGISLAEAQGVGGTFTGLVSHSCATIGLLVSSACSFNVTTYTGWRNGGVGLQFSAVATDCVLDTLTLFGNTTDNIAVAASLSNVQFKSVVSNGDSTFSTTNAIRNTVASVIVDATFDNCDFSTASGIKTAHTNDINVGNTQTRYAIVARNCKFGAATTVATPSLMSATGFISSASHNQTAGSHKTWFAGGRVEIDAAVFNTAAPSVLMTPTSASTKLPSGLPGQGMQVAVASGAAVTTSVAVRKSASYNGNQPRLIQRANPALGQNSDVVLATYSAGTGSWNNLSASSSTPSDDGVFEFYVDCDGTAGAINVDDWAAT